MDVWMLWVAGTGKPKVMHETYEAAMTEAKRLQAEKKVTQEIYIFRTHDVLPGRKLLTIRRTPNRCKVETAT